MRTKLQYRLLQSTDRADQVRRVVAHVIRMAIGRFRLCGHSVMRAMTSSAAYAVSLTLRAMSAVPAPCCSMVGAIEPAAAMINGLLNPRHRGHMCAGGRAYLHDVPIDFHDGVRGLDGKLFDLADLGAAQAFRAPQHRIYETVIRADSNIEFGYRRSTAGAWFPHRRTR